VPEPNSTQKAARGFLFKFCSLKIQSKFQEACKRAFIILRKKAVKYQLLIILVSNFNLLASFMKMIGNAIGELVVPPVPPPVKTSSLLTYGISLIKSGLKEI